MLNFCWKILYSFCPTHFWSFLCDRLFSLDSMLKLVGKYQVKLGLIKIASCNFFSGISKLRVPLPKEHNEALLHVGEGSQNGHKGTGKISFCAPVRLILVLSEKLGWVFLKNRPFQTFWYKKSFLAPIVSAQSSS